MSEEDQTADVVTLPKFDMPSYELNMSAKVVKSLAIRHGIPIDLHPVALTKGWTMDKLPDDMIGAWQGAYDLGVATPRALVYVGLMTSGDARSWYMISGDAKSWRVKSMISKVVMRDSRL
ncbi:hypothetical protein Tco_1257957 [Tanacetum coccineum]